MSSTATTTVRARRGKTYLPPKNRVGGFSSYSETSAGFFVTQASESHRENEPTPTTTASGMRFYGFRYYSPEVGRWVSRDPMGEIKLNLYEALLNDPNRYIDVNGLDIFGGGQNDVPPTAVSPPTYMGPHPFTGDIPTTLSEGKDPPCSGNIYTAVFSPCPCPKGLKCVLDIQRLVERRCMTEILPGLGAGGAPVLQPSPGGGIVGPDLSPEYIPVYGPWMLRQVLTWEKCVPECVDCSVRTLPPWEGGIPNPIVRITDTITECSL